MLSLLASLVQSRLGVIYKSLYSLLDDNQSGRKINNSAKRWNAFLNGTGKLSSEEFARIQERLIELIEEGGDDHPIRGDFAHLHSALMTLGLSPQKFENADDRIVRDRLFLDALGLSHGDQQRLLDRIGGFWFLIRYSGESKPEAEFNVSLLTVHDLKYIRFTDKGDVDVITELPHFYLHSPFGDRRAVAARKFQTFHGRVVEALNDICFVGSRVQSPKMMMMTWLPASVPDSHTKHAPEAVGIITTVSADDFAVTGPVAACYAPYSEEISKMRSARSPDELGANKDLWRSITNQARELRSRIGQLSREELLSGIGPLCVPDSLQNAILWLEEARRRSEHDGGNYTTKP